MNKKSKTLFLIAAFFGLMSNAYAVGWTAEIRDIRVWNNDKVEIFLSNPRDSNPAGNTWTCENDRVVVGNPVSQSMLYATMAAFTVGKTIRVDVIGANKTCSINYIETKENKSYDKSR